jgi:hypothetical protein
VNAYREHLIASAPIPLSPGDTVAVHSHPDVIDGTRGLVLDTSRSWAYVRLALSGDRRTIRTANLRRIEAAP